MPPILSGYAKQQRLRQIQPLLQRDLDHEPLNLGDEQFDTIVMLAVIEHLHRPEQLLLQVRPLLAPGGCLLLTTPSPFGDFVHRIGSRIGLFYSEDQVAHVKIFGKGDLFRLAELTGYAVIAYKRFQYQSNQMLVCRAANSTGNI